MKRKLIFFLPFLLMLGAGCLKGHDDVSNPLPKISGTYSGQFIRLRLNPNTNKYDTLKADITLSLDLTTGFAVSGDTTAHAASKGDYSYDSYYFLFSDKTYPTGSYPSKVHLAGTYVYGYNGTRLQLQQTYPLDTLGYFYDLTKN